MVKPVPGDGRGARAIGRGGRPILVTGAGGFLGTVLTELLLAEGFSVVAHDLFPNEPAENTTALSELTRRNSDLTVVRGDLRELGADLLADVSAVAHLAGLSNDASCEFDAAWSREINHEATVRLGQLCAERGGVHLVFASSCSVYGASDTDVLCEESELGPLSIYAETKRDSEQELLALTCSGLGVICLRMGTLFGASPKMRFDLVPNQMALTAIQEGVVRVGGGGRQWRPLLHVEEAARVFVAALQRPNLGTRGSVLNVVGENHQIAGLGEIVGDALGVRVETMEGSQDPRSYRVSGASLNRAMNLIPAPRTRTGVEEVAELLSRGEFGDPQQDRYYPVRTAEKLYRGLSSRECRSRA
ncbi:MAG: SDR family oxidoreductase [Planctomycetota bacterium]